MRRFLKGQSLFEVVGALAVISVLLVGLISITTTSVKNTTFSRNNETASGYAQQLAEWMRSERDANWTTFKGRGTTSPSYCFNAATLGWTNTGICAPDEVVPGTLFRRQATIICYLAGAQVVCSNVGVDTINVDIKVTWTDGQGDHSVNLTTQLTNWKSN